MGERFKFTCAGCGFSTEVAGGPDAGEVGPRVTISCSTCKELHDVDPRKVTAGHHKCPRSRTRQHETSAWKHPGPCPACGRKLRRSKEPTVFWD